MHSKWQKSGHVYLFLILYIFATPLGYTAGVYVHNANIISENLSQIITAFIAGTFLHISTTIVFENSLRKKEGLSKWALILSGLGISYLACWIG
jgi:zinc transporter ZupT